MNTRPYLLGVLSGIIPAVALIAVLGCATPPAPSPSPTATTTATEPEEWVPPCTDWLADHGGICQGEPVEWGFSSGDTLVCGQGAKPALDYRGDAIGWWAYCEPALVQK